MSHKDVILVKIQGILEIKMSTLFLNFYRKSNTYRLPAVNIKRCNAAVAFVAIFIPLILFINIVFFDQTLIRPEYNKYLFTIFIVSLIYLVLAYKVEKERRGKKYYKILYRSVMLVYAVLFAILSNSFFKIENSLFYFFISMLFFAIVPVFNMYEMLVSEMCAIAFMVYMVEANSSEKSLAMQIVWFNFVRIAVMLWKYRVTFNNLELTKQIKFSDDVNIKDEATTLYNKKGLIRKIHNIWHVMQKNRASCGFITVGIDYYKKYEETYGEEKTKEAIKNVADSIKDVFRERTDLIARIDNKRFLVVVNEVDKKELIYLSKIIERKVEELGIENSKNLYKEVLTITTSSTFVPNCKNVDYMDVLDRSEKNFSKKKKKKKEQFVEKNTVLA